MSYLKANEAADLLKSMLGLGVEDKTLVKLASKSDKPKVISEDEAPKEEMTVVFRKEGRVVSYPAGNAIVVSTTAFKMGEVRQVLKAIDKIEGEHGDA